jgi:hypothetical protein
MRALALFLIIVGCRSWFVDRSIANIPFNDAWDAEASDLFVPCLHGHLAASAFFAAHNEHRIVLTRLVSLGLFKANNNLWDPRIEILFNTVWVALMAVVMAGLLAHGLPAHAGKMYIATALVWLPPYGWENALFGFQSQFYFMIFFSLAALWCLSAAPERTTTWWIGAGASALSCLSLSSGCFAPFVALGVRIATGRRAEGRRIDWRGLAHEHADTCALCLLVGASATMGFRHTSENDGLMAQNLFSFCKTLGYALSWPLLRIPAACVVFYWPAYLVARRGILKNGVLSPIEKRMLAVAGWAIAQAVAIAVFRGVGGHAPTSRYLDILAVGCLANFVLLMNHRATFSRLFVRAWVAMAVAGLVWGTAHEIVRLPERLRSSREQLRRCRAYMETGDSKTLTALAGPNDLPYPDLHRLQFLLDDPTVRSFLSFPLKDVPRSARLSRLSAWVYLLAPEIFAAGAIAAAAAQARALRPKLSDIRE